MSAAPTLTERQRPPLRRRPPDERYLHVRDLVQQIRDSRNPLVWVRWRNSLGPFHEWCVLIGLATGAGGTGDHLVIRNPAEEHLLRTVPLTLLESITRDEP